MTAPETYSPRVPPRRRRIGIRGVEYSVTEWGDEQSPLIVYLHGFADCAATFQFVIDEMTRDWYVVAPDWRGFGETQPPVNAFWFQDYLADLDHLLHHYSPKAAVRLIGHSMGGNVAGLYAGVMPERVREFINLEGFGLDDTKPEDAPKRYRDWLAGSRKLPSATRRDSFERLANAIRARNRGVSEARANFIAHCWATETADGSVRLHVNPAHKLPNPVLYRRAEAEACWRQVTARVLLVAGTRSDFGSPEGLPFPRSQIVSIEDAGHMLHFDQPAVLARAIEEFLDGPGE